MDVYLVTTLRGVLLISVNQSELLRITSGSMDPANFIKVKGLQRSADDPKHTYQYLNDLWLNISQIISIALIDKNAKVKDVRHKELG